MQSRPFNALTVDVEDYFHVAALAKAIRREDWDTLAPRVESNTKRLLDIFDEAEITATFFVLGWVAERYPRLIEEIDRRGHEVGSHGFSHQLIYRQSPTEFGEETSRSKKLLEDLIGNAVLGYRAASYSITSESLWALDIIVETGFRYDSSVVPVRHDLYGVPGAKAVPHRLVTESGAEVIEFPPSTLEVLGLQMPVGGGGYFRLYPYGLSRYFLNKINKYGDPFIFYLHPWEIDPDQPRVDNLSLRSRFRHYLNLDKTELRLNRLIRDFRFTTVKSVLATLQLLN
jgi:polysaccharide deacetylase family protein (PEP-CTERM system associated)